MYHKRKQKLLMIVKYQTSTNSMYFKNNLIFYPAVACGKHTAVSCIPHRIAHKAYVICYL